MIDLKLDSQHDLMVKEGKLVLVSGVNLVAQRVKITLLTFLGEWFMDTTIGIPYLEQILVKPADKTKLENIFRKKILSVNGVNKIISIDTLINRTERLLQIKFSVETGEGVLRDVVEVGAR
ncbi:hypothetical protein [Mannheimia bovis]|uniref:DUF2634 domain-containing protein n=1 Tax=Mannheimia bovis TaxID=2770636 RepID=A0A7H1C0S2_9PAST|nr:hypothetical protein [Mannheimia bovis]QNS14577.1 hypothetical protein ICJ55_07380 [Mannheimia bovis]